MKHLSGILDYTQVRLFHPPMLLVTHKQYLYHKMGSNILQMVHIHASGLNTGA